MTKGKTDKSVTRNRCGQFAASYPRGAMAPVRWLSRPRRLSVLAVFIVFIVPTWWIFLSGAKEALAENVAIQLYGAPEYAKVGQSPTTPSSPTFTANGSTSSADGKEDAESPWLKYVLAPLLGGVTSAFIAGIFSLRVAHYAQKSTGAETYELLRDAYVTQGQRLTALQLELSAKVPVIELRLRNIEALLRSLQ